MTRAPLHVRALVLFIVHQTTMGVGTVAGLTLVVPTIVEEFDTNVTTAAWVQLAYFLALAGGTFALGQTTTLLDKRKLIVLGNAGDVLVMILAFYTNSILILIVTRFFSAFFRIYPWLILQVMGVGGFPPHQRGKVLGLSGAMMGMGILISVPLTGFVEEHWGWRWLFMGSAAVFVLHSVAVWLLIPPQPRPADAPKPTLAEFDLQGSVLMMVGVVAMLTTIQGVIRGFDGLVVAATGATAAVALVGFVWVERRSKTPVVRFSLFRIRGVFMGAAQAGLMGWVTGSVQLLMPILFVVGYGWSVTQAAGVLFFFNIVRPVSGFASGWLADRYGSPKVVAVAAGVAVVGQVSAVLLGMSPPVQMVILALVLMGTGQAFMMTANQRQLFNAIPRHQLHLAPSTSLVLMTFGNTTGQAVAAAMVELGSRPEVAGLADPAMVTAVSTALVVLTVVFAVGMVAAQVLPVLLTQPDPATQPVSRTPSADA